MWANVLALIFQIFQNQKIIMIYAQGRVDQYMNQCFQIFKYRKIKNKHHVICTGKGGTMWTVGWSWVTLAVLYLASRYDDHDHDEDDGYDDDDDDKV